MMTNDEQIGILAEQVDRLLLVMQACLIEAEQGNKEAALRWIWNTLDGPGLIPDFEEARALGGAQAFYDKRRKKLEDGET